MKTIASLPIKNQLETLASDRVEWFRDRLCRWATENLRDYPWRQTSEPYAILVAEFLLQKTDADTVVPVYQSFLSEYPTLHELAAATPEEVRNILQPLGLLFRAERLVKCARIILEQDRGQIPDAEAQLLKLPGIGKYTARAICSQAFSQPSAVLDTNVARILERFWGWQGDRVKSRCPLLWQAADILAPQENVGRWNLTLLDFGAKICTAKNPSCEQCPLQLQCNYGAASSRSLMRRAKRNIV